MERQPLSTSVNDRDTLPRLEAELARVRGRIQAACERSGRSPEDVRLVAVTKEVDPWTVRLAATAGVEEFGENYVQDLERKREAAPGATWHFVGRLQRNKVRRGVGAAGLVETLGRGGGGDRR